MTPWAGLACSLQLGAGCSAFRQAAGWLGPSIWGPTSACLTPGWNCSACQSSAAAREANSCTSSSGLLSGTNP